METLSSFAQLTIPAIVALSVIATLVLTLLPGIWWMRRRILGVKVAVMQKLPLTLDKIDADKEVIRAHHKIELRRLQLKIAEAEASEAEARAEAQEALGRIEKLNRRIEMLQLKLAARNTRRDIRKIDEQLIQLDEARLAADDKAA